MSEDNQLTAEDERIAKKAFTAFLSGRMHTIGNILARLPNEQRVRITKYGLQPKIKAYRKALMSDYRSQT